MKKNILLLLVLGLLLMPIQAFAAGAGEEYQSMNLLEILEDEGIEPEFSNYKETEDQAVIYLFRGKGCSFCKSFIEYLNSITEEYGKYFKVVSYETWNDSNNKKLSKEVSNFLDEDASGVPFIIIGDESFLGYTSQYDEGIIEAIMDLYESKERYDVFEEMAKGPSEGKSVSSTSVIIWNLVFVTISTGIIMVFVQHKHNLMNRRLDAIENKLKYFNKEKKSKE